MYACQNMCELCVNVFQADMFLLPFKPGCAGACFAQAGVPAVSRGRVSE